MDLRPLAEVPIRLAPEPGALPADRAAAFFAEAGQLAHSMGTSRDTAEWIVQWEAPALAHKPLYFEEINVERYGYSLGWLQPVASAAHFFGRIPTLPYLIVSERGHQCRYSLGHARPGDCHPYYCHWPEFRLGAGTFEAAVVAGAIIAFP